MTLRQTFFCFLCLTGFAFWNTSMLRAQSNTSPWQEVLEDQIPKQNADRHITPTEFRTYKLDLVELEAVLREAPRQRTPIASISKTLLELPLPDGRIKTFDIVESPIMEPELAQKFPDINTYAGVAVDDPGMYVRFDLTPQGFHAMIMIAGKSTVYIDPYYFNGDRDHYIVYDREHFRPASPKNFTCHVGGSSKVTNKNFVAPNIKAFGSCELRTYRIAIAATGEYTTFHGGTVALAQAAQVTTMNRVNSVYERDMAITMTIVGNNNLLIYTNATTDPYTNGAPATMIAENQTNVDAIITPANYDIGHVFGTNSGGLAGLGVVCANGAKARGVTGSGAPVGDPFDIDYVAHEVGHQFACNHTFNNACGGNRNNGTAYEPGSGSTIMAYAGICPPNIQFNSDDHFHGGSLEEMGAFITGGGHTCPVTTALSNNPPVITATGPTGLGGTYNIPASTPFALTATASDPDGNTLTYCWEQMDNDISTQAPVATSTNGPNFRSFSPSLDNTRYFPNLADQLAGITPTWEVLSSVTRDYAFRVTVRDNAAGGGCNEHQDLVVSVDGSSGPFIVTYPSATGITWTGATNETVTWDVANTDQAPVSCANVDILLSLDGGLTYPTVLASNVPNDGSEVISVPNTASTTARVKVVCSDNIFYDVSDNDFTIVVATFDYSLTTTSSSLDICPPTNGTYSIDVGSIGGYIDPVTLTVTGAPTGVTTAFVPSPVTPGNTSALTISNTATATPGTYTLTVTGNSTSGIKTLTLTLNIIDTNAPTLATPTNGATNVNPATMTWGAIAGTGVTYDIDIASDPSFGTIVESATGLIATSYTASSLVPNTTYYWRVRSNTSCGASANSTTFSFTTDACVIIASANVPITIPNNATSTQTSNLSVGFSGTITDINVVSLSGTHTYIEDLSFDLASPAGTSVNLWSNICTNQNDFDVNFDDAAAAGALPCPPVGGGTYQPQGASTLADFNGEDPSGTWVLTFSDNFAQDGGELQSWGLEVCISAPSCAVAATSTDVTCNGGNDGTATASPSGGTGPYTYLWSNGQTTQTITGLVANTYIVTVTDNTGCTATTSVAVADPTALTVTATATDVACNGGNDGTATASPAGGTAPYTYTWSNSQTTQVITGLVANTYDITITDDNGCSANTSVVVADPTAITATSASTDESCAGNDGTATVAASGGTGAYTYLWSDGQTTATATGLTAATYTVTITDVNACTDVQTVVVNDGCIPCTLTASTIGNDVDCNGGNNGTASASPANGSAPYTYLWSNGQISQAITGLVANTYTVTITDNSGCTATATQIVSEPAAITATSASTDESCTGNDGTATVAASGGTGAYTYLWSDGQ
ncbi:MAG: M12 family metallo-peptidase, partial [Saprospiraceae bacterium]|nr:M12 family metallo-peptidase [Saprospiraceae bacterium]